MLPLPTRFRVEPGREPLLGGENINNPKEIVTWVFAHVCTEPTRFTYVL